MKINKRVKTVKQQVLKH